MESEGSLPSFVVYLVKILWSKNFQVERIDPRGSHQISYTVSVSSSTFSPMLFSFDSVGYGSGFSSDVYGFFHGFRLIWFFYLVVDKCSSSVSPGLIIDMGVSSVEGV